MSDTGPTAPLRPAPPRSRNPLTRISIGWVLMLLAGLVSATLYLVITKQDRETILVAVAKQNIVAGSVFQESMVEYLPMRIPDAQTKSLILESDVKSKVKPLTGLVFSDSVLVFSDSVEKGSLIKKSLLKEVEGSVLRQMSFTVTPAQSVGGTLKVGDRIDIIDVRKIPGTSLTVAEYAATNVEIIAVSKSDGLRLGSGGGSGTIVTIKVDAPRALRIALALDDKKYEVVRSTAAPEVNDSDQDPKLNERGDDAPAITDDAPPELGEVG